MEKRFILVVNVQLKGQGVYFPRVLNHEDQNACEDQRDEARIENTAFQGGNRIDPLASFVQRY